MLILALPILIIELAVVLGVRLGVGRALGIQGLRFVPTRSAVDFTDAVKGVRIVILVATFVAAYLLSSVFFAAGSLAAGKQLRDNRVDVFPGRPAAAAGLRDEDRIVAIAGEKTATFEAISAAVARAHGAPVDVEVDRGGTVLHFEVAPAPPGDANAKIGVKAIVTRAPYPLDEALTQAVLLPARLFVDVARGFVETLAPHSSAEMIGPIGIIEEAAAAPAAFALAIAGPLSAYEGIPFALLVAALALPRRKPR